MAERLVIAFAAWGFAIAYVALRRHYSRTNLLLVAVGSALTLAALAADPAQGVLISLGALGAGLWVTGYEWEKRRMSTAGERQRVKQPSRGQGGSGSFSL